MSAITKTIVVAAIGLFLPIIPHPNHVLSNINNLDIFEVEIADL